MMLNVGKLQRYKVNQFQFQWQCQNSIVIAYLLILQLNFDIEIDVYLNFFKEINQDELLIKIKSNT